MPHDTVCVFDSSYPSVDIALPIDERRHHVIVSRRRIEPPPGHTCLRIENESGMASIWRNFRTLRRALGTESTGECIVIAAPAVRPEELLLNVAYAIWLRRSPVLFDGVSFHSMMPFWGRLLKGLAVRLMPRVFAAAKLRMKITEFNFRVRSAPDAKTEEGKLFGLFGWARSFSLPLDRITLEADRGSVYGSKTRGWYLPAYSSRLQRYDVQTTRHRLRAVMLHVEKLEFEVSSLFKDGKILDYPYMLGPARKHHLYPVRCRENVKRTDRAINLLAYTSTYYHWLIEGVPRILDVIDDGFDFDKYPLILPPLEPFQRELLKVLDIDPDSQVIPIGIGDWCHVGECIFPTANFPFASVEIEDPSGQPNRALLLRIRERLLERPALRGRNAGRSLPKRIYVSRARAARRKLTEENEAAVTAMLESAGFQRVFLEDLSWPDQVRTLSNSELIVGVHGAGLANMLFGEPKALLEFHNPLEARPYFAVMARELDVEYSYLIGSLRGTSASYDNIEIDLRLLSEWLSRQ